MEIYSQWWRELEKCSGRTRDLHGIRWFLADQIGSGTGHTLTTVKGQWLSNREITIKTGYEDDYKVVKHEMLHDLLRGDRTHAHESWGLCDQREGMPRDPIIPTGTYDYELFWTEGLKEWRFEGTLTITFVTENEVQGTWNVSSVNSTTDSQFASQILSGDWDYDAYAVAAQTVGEHNFVIENRIVREDGEVKCMIALIGFNAHVCKVDGPR